MEYEELIKIVKLLSTEDQARLAAELLDNLKEGDGSLSQLLPISDAMLAVPGHTLDMQVEGKPIYNHLEIFKEHLLDTHANNDGLIKALLALTEKIKQFKLHTPPVNLEEQSIDIKDRTILTGDQQGNGGSTKTGVQGVTYLRNEGFTQNPPVKVLIEEIKSYGLSEADAVRLFVLIAGLPKAGYQDSHGERHLVGNCGYFAVSAVQNGEVEFLGFSDDNACLGSGPASHALPSLSNWELEH